MKNKIFKICMLLFIALSVLTLTTSCQFVKDFAGTNKDNIKEIMKSLVGEVVEEIFKQILKEKPVNLDFVSPSLSNNLTRNIISPKIIEGVDIKMLKEHFKLRIKEAIDKKEYSANDKLFK